MPPRLPLAAALLGALFVTPAAATSIVVPMHPVVVAPGQRLDGLAFPPGTRAWILDATGEVSSIELRQDFTLGRHRLKKGSRLRLDERRLRELETVRGQVVDGIRFDAGAQVAFDTHGRITEAHIDHDTPIDRYVFAGNSWISFHPSGRVAQGELARAAVRDGLRIAPGEITFHPSGRLASAVLQAGSTWHGLALQRGVARFRADGSLAHALLAGPATIDGVACERGEFGLFASGHLAFCRGMPDPARIAYACADGKTLYTQIWDGRSVAFDMPGTQHRLGRVASHGGERYADDAYEWQPPGDGDSTGTLRERAGGKVVFAGCRIGPGGGRW
jgi:membrane-bound inhibitor of C-type lysozyme